MNVNVYAFTLLNHYIFFIYIINETLRFISYIIYELISISMIIIDYWLPRRAPCLCVRGPIDASAEARLVLDLYGRCSPPSRPIFHRLLLSPRVGAASQRHEHRRSSAALRIT